MENDTLIIVFAKAPIPGAAKTRLIPALGEVGAAMLHTALTERVLATAISTGHSVDIACAPDCEHVFFEDCEEEFDVSLTPQITDPNLGARMLHALRDALDEFAKVIIVGADCPAFTKAHLVRAATALATHDVVLTPVEDGGYVLIGARRTEAAMFAGVAWGTPQVLAQQREALTHAGLTWCELETLWDVDRPVDLARLKTLKPPLDFSWGS